MNPGQSSSSARDITLPQIWPHKPIAAHEVMYTVNEKKTWQYIFDYNLG